MDDKVAKKIGRQLSVASSNNHYADVHRQQAEMALNGNSGLASPPNGQKESFFSHLRKRARRFSGRQSQTPISPKSMDIEAQAGCGPWASNRSSMVLDNSQLPSPAQKVETYEALDKALRNVQQNLDSSQNGNVPVPPSHLVTSSSTLKRHHSLPGQQARSADNLRAVGPISSRTRRSQVPGGARQYETPDEEDELLDEVLTSTHKAMKKMDRNSIQGEGRQAVRQSNSNLGLSNPYPTPSPSASGNAVLFGQVHQLTVDAYAVQHAGGQHPDKSVCVHLVGLYLMLERGVAPLEVPPLLQRLASGTTWPHLDPPKAHASLTVYDVAIAEAPQTHAMRVREWAAEVWGVWSAHHYVARELARDLAGPARRAVR